MELSFLTKPEVWKAMFISCLRINYSDQASQGNASFSYSTHFGLEPGNYSTRGSLHSPRAILVQTLWVCCSGASFFRKGNKLMMNVGLCFIQEKALSFKKVVLFTFLKPEVRRTCSQTVCALAVAGAQAIRRRALIIQPTPGLNWHLWIPGVHCIHPGLY
jgi:hypothetical protein